MTQTPDNPQTPDVEELFRSAHEEGDLSLTSLQTLTVHADVGLQIQAGLGVAADDVASAEVVLVTLMPDDSGSIRFAGNTAVVSDGHNLVLESLRESQQSGSVLVHTRYLNGQVLYPYGLLDDAIEMSSLNYNPNLGTPLYDQTAVVLGTVIAKSKEFEDHGIPVRSVTLLISDGADVHSTRQSARSVRALVEDLLRSESHIVAALGIDDGETDFRQVFRDMGLRDEWILTPGNSTSEIRRAFQVFSRSAVQASQGAGHLSRLGLGGSVG